MFSILLTDNYYDLYMNLPCARIYKRFRKDDLWAIFYLSDFRILQALFQIC